MRKKAAGDAAGGKGEVKEAAAKKEKGAPRKRAKPEGGKKVVGRAAKKVKAAEAAEEVVDGPLLSGDELEKMD